MKQTIIGLGSAGCNIAEKFKSYPNYRVLKIDSGKRTRETKDNFVLREQKEPELYEEKLSAKIKNFVKKDTTPETMLITSCGMISGCALALLQGLHKKTKISIMYIVPDGLNLTEKQKLQNNLLFNVFQEYARSGVFEKVVLVDNRAVSDIIGPVPVLKYWDTINDAIAGTYHTINMFENTHPVFTTFSNKVNTAKIVSIGAAHVDSEKNEKNMFFSLDIPREKRYYYAIPQKMLEEDAALMNVIKENIKNSVEHDRMKVGYAIYPTSYEQPYVYCENYSTLIQKNPVS